MSMSDFEATRLVLQNEYLRGTLCPTLEAKIKKEFPQAIPDWNKMKLRMKMKLTKFRKKLKDILIGCAHKSMGCRRFRPGKEKQTLRGLLVELERQFHASGLDVLVSWVTFYNQISVNLGGSVWTEEY